MISKHLYFLPVSPSVSLPGLLTALALVAVLLAGCETQPRQPGSADRQADPEVTQQVSDLLAQARTSESPERDQLYLEAARLLVDVGETDWARNLLVSVDPDVLFQEDFVDYTLLFSRIAIDDDAYFLAQRILTNPRLEQQWQQLPAEVTQTLRQRRAELFSLLGESAESVNERISLSQLNLSQEQQAQNQDALWRSLMAMPQKELERRRQQAENRLARGWYALAALSKNSETDIEHQLASIEQWRDNWPQHPASQRLPSDLQLLQQLVENQPRVVGVLLPLTGPYGASGRAVRDGLMAAYYQAMARGSTVPEIRLFDTHNRKIDEVYDLAVADGAEMIVGPLLKHNLEALNLRLQLPVETLALNTVDSQYGFSDRLYQFGLLVEDEARQIAERAWLEGHRNAMILVQQSETGQRAADTFGRAWREQGGHIVQRSYFADQVDYQAVVKESLLIDQSQQRASELRRLLNREIKFEEPRRRQDIDLIFMMSRPEEARLLKPTLNFYYASDLPVYATRHIYNGSQDKQSYDDLNGIRFTTLPWQFSNSDIKQTIQTHANPSPAYQQFYAMGVDAYRLYPRLKQLQQIPGARFYGSTGALELTEQRRITRREEWVQIVDGKAMPLPMVVSDVYVE